MLFAMTTARARSRVANGGPMQQRGRRIVEARLGHVGDDVGNLNLCPRRVEPDDRQGERGLAMIRVQVRPDGQCDEHILARAPVGYPGRCCRGVDARQHTWCKRAVESNLEDGTFLVKAVSRETNPNRNTAPWKV